MSNVRYRLIQLPLAIVAACCLVAAFCVMTAPAAKASPVQASVNVQALAPAAARTKRPVKLTRVTAPSPRFPYFRIYVKSQVNRKCTVFIKKRGTSKSWHTRVAPRKRSTLTVKIPRHRTWSLQISYLCTGINVIDEPLANYFVRWD